MSLNNYPIIDNMAEAFESRPSFYEQLRGNWDQGKSLCVGLDADVNHKKFPPHLKVLGRYRAQKEFLLEIVDATHDIVLAYKPNIAFFEDNADGEAALAETVQYIHKNYPAIPVIVDAKRGDIANTNRGYAVSLWERYGFDATTVHSYLGQGTYPPFLNHIDDAGKAYPGKGIIAMCKTSNPDAPDIQDLMVCFKDSVQNNSMKEEETEELRERLGNGRRSPQKATLYTIMAYRHGKLWEQNNNIGIVVGATHPKSFGPVRRVYDGAILIPGIGTQGGDLELTLRFAPDSRGQGMIINSASGIIFASNGKDFAEAARNAAEKLHSQITNLRAK